MKLNLSQGETKLIYVANILGIPENGSKVFPFFDDFSNQTITNDRWNISTTGAGGSASISNGNITVQGNYAGGAGEANLYTRESFGAGFATVFFGSHNFITVFNTERARGGWMNCSGANCASFLAFDAIYRSGTGRLDNNLWVSNGSGECPEGGGGQCLSTSVGSASSTFNGGFNYTYLEKPNLDQLYEIKRVINETSFSLNFSQTTNRRVVNNSNLNYPSNTSSLNMGFSSSNGNPTSNTNIRLDWAFIRPAVYEEPSVSREMDASGQIIYTITNNANGSLTNYAVRLLDGNFTIGDLNIQDTDLAHLYTHQARLAKPVFLNTPYYLGDLPHMATIYRHGLSINASVIIEWYVNDSLVKNTTRQVNANVSITDNISTNFSQIGANISVFVRASTYYQQTSRKNASITIVIPQCQDGIDNDFDGLIDYPTDTHCTSLLDNDEDQPETVSAEVAECVPTSAGGGSYTPISYDPVETIFDLSAPQQSLIEDIFDTLKSEVCGNEIDDDNNGFIDEDCERSIEVTTENFQKRYHFVMNPGETRKATLLIKNLETTAADTSLACSGSPLCSKVTFIPSSFTNAQGKEQKAELTITLPMTETVGNNYVFKAVGRDLTHSSSDNVLISVSVSSSGGLVRRFSEVFTKPFYCTSVASNNAKNFCLDPLTLIGSLLGIGLSLFILTQVARRLRK